MKVRVVLCKRLAALKNWDTIEIAIQTGHIRRGQVVVGLSGGEFRIAAGLIGSVPQQAIHPVSELVDALFGDRADGGPDDADAYVRRTIYRLRLKLGCLGIAIPSEFSLGYRALVLTEPKVQPNRVFRPRRADRRTFRTKIEQLYAAINEGRCEDALLVLLDQAYPAYRLFDLAVEDIAA